MKKLLTIIVVITLSFAICGCANSVFMANYLSPATDKAYSDFCRENFSATAPQFDDAEGKYSVKGELRLTGSYSDIYYSADLTLDFTKKTINGKTRTVRSTPLEYSDVTTSYATKKSIITKKTEEDSVKIKSSEADLKKLVSIPDEVWAFYSAMYDKMLKMSSSYVEIAEDFDSANIHVKITPETAPYLLFNGIATESATGDVYFSIDSECLYAAKFLLKASRGDNYNSAGDIITGIFQNYTDVVADFTIKPI